MSNPIHVPPHNVDAERSVLGSIMIEKNAILKIIDLIQPDDFYFDVHGIIFASMQDLYAKHSPIDILTVKNWLKDNGKLDEVGGQTMLEDLVNSVLTASHVLQYALIVKEKSTRRKLISSGANITALAYQEEEEIDVLVDKAEQELFKVSQTFLRNRFVHIKEVVGATYERISELHDPETAHKYKGVQTGYQGLDHILTGMQPSDLIILAARPSMGKTALALNIAENVAKAGKSVGVISLEMSKEQLVERLFVSLLGVDGWKLKTGQLAQDDFLRMGRVMDQLHQLQLYIDDSADVSITELRAKTRRLQMQSGLDLLIIDYLQLMNISNTKGGFTNRVQEISEISRALKSLARELHIPIIALSQLSRAVESRPIKVPQLSDLRDSGAIEQDADVVLMMYREEYYEEDTERQGVTDIYIRKHRHGGVGRVELMFKKEQLRFFDLEKQHRFEDIPAMD